MKKNRMLKLASAMVILCLITTCAISTTFAKYTTGGSANDEARVAKWGVNISMLGDGLFANEYSDAVNGNGLTVKSTTDVVAPGTSSDESTAAVFAITGTPEVAVNVKVEFVVTNYVYLGVGTYDDETTATVLDDEFDIIGTEYDPIVFTLTQTKAVDANGNPITTSTDLYTGTLKGLEAFLAGWSTDYAPNTVLDSEFTITWAWAFDGNDQADTFLGNRIVDGHTGSWNLTLGYTLTVTATQID